MHKGHGPPLAAQPSPRTASLAAAAPFPQGFVSNRTTDASASGADPVEALLYKAFVASSERLALADLAGILAVPVEELQVCLQRQRKTMGSGAFARFERSTMVAAMYAAGQVAAATRAPLFAPRAPPQVAMSVACRLGFATRLAPAGGDAAAAALAAAAAGAAGGAGGAPARLPISTPNSSAFSIAEELEEDIPAPGAATGAGVQVGGAGGGGAGGGALVADGAAIAVVVDSEATSYLMMGALSPGGNGWLSCKGLGTVLPGAGGRAAPEGVALPRCPELRRWRHRTHAAPRRRARRPEAPLSHAF